MSGFVVFAVVVAVGGATYSFFSDSETSNNNTFTAGSIDLSIGSRFSSNGNANGGPASFVLDSTNDGRALYNFTDLKPGDFGSGSFQLNVTSNESYACAMSTIDSKPDNGRVDPETDEQMYAEDAEADNKHHDLAKQTHAGLRGLRCLFRRISGHVGEQAV